MSLISEHRARRRIPGAVLHWLRGRASLCPGRNRRPAEEPGMGGAAERRDSRTGSSRWPGDMAAKRTMLMVALVACSAPTTANSPIWAASRLPRCSARSDCRAAASASAMGIVEWRWKARSMAIPVAVRAARQRTRCRTPSRSRGWPTCCSSPAVPSTSTARTMSYPDIRLVYWAGGNPFHHHQDLNRLVRRGKVLRRSSCTSPSGLRRRAMPTSCCRSPRPLERDDHRLFEPRKTSWSR